MKRIAVLAALGMTLLVGPLAATEPRPIRLRVDATEIERKLFTVEETIPVEPGPVTLVYPKWSYNAPIGSLNDMVRLVVRAGDRRLEWHRDLVEMFAFHLVVPDGVREIRVELSILGQTLAADGLGAVTAEMFLLEWQRFLLVPAGVPIDSVPVEASVRLPAGWRYAAALDPSNGEGPDVAFRAVSLEVLADSPMLAGHYFRTETIAEPGKPTLYVDMAGESASAVEMPAIWRERLVRLHREAGALFGEYPFPEYHLLLLLSDDVGDDGLEHRRSADLRLREHFFGDEDYRRAYGYLVPHELAHAWNGRYRQPGGTATRDLQEPQRDDLLWVYEGLTRYLNWVLGVRSGILTVDEGHEYAAFLAAKMDTRSGREWRSLQDTATAAPVQLFAPSRWQAFRREADFYDESFALWLEVDATLRRLTHGARSLDDFCRTFLRPPSRDARPRTFGFDDVVSALEALAPFDWAALLRRRLDATGTDGGPHEGLEAAGWSLAYDTHPNAIGASRDAINATVEERFAVGLLTGTDGVVVDAVGNSAAWTAGLAPDMKILSIDGAPWSPEALHAAVARTGGAPLALVVQNGSRRFNAALRSSGARAPHLVRNANPDLLDEILHPLAPQTP